MTVWGKTVGRRLAGAVLVVALITASARGRETVREATVCEVKSHLQKYNGRMVRVRGRVVQGFEWFFLESEECALDLAYPDGPSDLGPMATFKPYAEPRTRAKFKVRRDENYEKLVELANSPAPLPQGCMCLGCYRYQVTATITGLLEVAKRGYPGFGHMNAAEARLVIRSVSDVVAVDMIRRYEALACGPPRLIMPRTLNPDWDRPASGPPFPNGGPKPQ